MQQVERDRCEASLPGRALSKASFETAAVGMWFLSGQGRVLAANEAAARLVGCSVRELVGRRSFEFTHPDDQASSASLPATWMPAVTRSATSGPTAPPSWSG